MLEFADIARPWISVKQDLRSVSECEPGLFIFVCVFVQEMPKQQRQIFGSF
jgi:hypothetical protein